MRKSEHESALNSLQEYLDNFNLTGVTDNIDQKRALKKIYKRYHAILIWHGNIGSGISKYFDSSEELDNFSMYFNECVSDLCQSILLWAQGLYKPSYLILRSSIENFVKCLGLYGHQNVIEIESTYDLLRVVGATDMVQSTSETKKIFNSLRNKYKDLCKHVHTSDENHMSLTTFVGVYPKIDIDKSSEYSSTTITIMQNYYTILGYMFRKKLNSFHHRDKDYIYDVMVRNARKELSP